MKIGVYIHIPFCSAKCSYCDFASFSCAERGQRGYVSALLREIEGRCAGQGFVVDTVFIGGGTPSVLYAGGLTQIIDCLKKYTDFAPVEFTVEANPESVTPLFAAELAEISANRMSLGLQTASDELLKNLRRHSYSDFLRAVDTVKKAGISNISADLMLGLPDQKLTDVQDSVTKIKELKLSHISVYGLKVEEGTPLEKSGFTAQDEEIAAQFSAAKNLLGSDYNHYEVSNFAKKSCECRHNQKYWTMQPYLGLGLNASSFLHGKRLTNTRDFDQYLRGEYADFCEDAAQNFLTEYIMLGLRTAGGISISTLKKHGLDIQTHAEIQNFLSKNIMQKNEDTLTINPDYYYVMNSILTKII